MFGRFGQRAARERSDGGVARAVGHGQYRSPHRGLYGFAVCRLAPQLRRLFRDGIGSDGAARGREPLFEKIGWLEQSSRVVGVLESSKVPGDEVCRDVARQCHVEPEQVMLLVARTASLAGTVQIVARSVETALHKLLELQFDPAQVVAGFGSAPMPPVARDDLTGIGRTNDAVLYGARVTLWVRGDDSVLREIGPRLPSCGSPDFGRPFTEIFEHYERDFYRIDPLLFSPSEVHFINVESGHSFSFGQPAPEILIRSFGVEHVHDAGS